MDTTKFIPKLTKLGNVEFIKAGKVFTLILKNKKGFNLAIFIEIGDAIPEVIQKYPSIEAMKISEEYFFIVLASQTKK